MSMALPLSELPDILNGMESGEYERVVNLLQPFISAPSKQQKQRLESSSVVLYLYASIQCEKYENLLQWAEQQSNSSLSKEGSDSHSHIQRILLAYAYYQLKQYTKVIALYKQQQQPESNDDVRLYNAWEHLYAQSLYHLRSDFPRIVQVYDGLLSQPQEKEFTIECRIHTWTNLLAVFLAFYSVPYCSFIDSFDLHPKEVSDDKNFAVDDPMSRVQSSIQTHVLAIKEYIGSGSNEVASPELVYNLASYLLPGIAQQKQRRFWIERLQRAMEQLADTCANEGNASQYIKDIVPVQMNRTLFDHHYWNATRRPNNGFTIFNHLSWTIRDMNSKQQTHLLLPDDDASLLALLPQQVLWVYRMNQLLLSPNNTTTNEAMIAFLKEILSNEEHPLVLTNSQLHILYYTLALYYYYDQQYVECQVLCQYYFLSTATTKSKKKKQAAALNGATPNAASYCSLPEQRFWECRATVLWAYCSTSSDASDRGDRIAALDKFCQNSSSPTSFLSKVEDHVQVYARVHQVALLAKGAPNVNMNDKIEAYNILKLLPPSLQTKPAIQSTMRRLQPSASNNEFIDSSMSGSEKDIRTVQKLKDMVSTIRQSNSEPFDASVEVPNCIAYGDFAMSQSLYADAAILYEVAVSSVKRQPMKKNDSNHSQYLQSLTAKYVCALSHVDPSVAIALWSNMSVPPLISEGINSNSIQSGAELERKEIAISTISPVHPTAGAITPAVSKDDAAANKEKRCAARLRRRARQRELYVQTLPASSRNSTPRPDRWRPRYERRAAQGGGSADAGALDVVARQANREAQVKSTAHMNVSGGKGGKNKKRR